LEKTITLSFEIAPKEYERWLNWDDSKLYCTLLILNEQDDWRLPTLTELNHMFKSENDFASTGYWSSSEGISNDCGTEYYGGKVFSCYVRPVRTIK
jgi:hypothetical protein